jgi:hypothetical protein
MAFVLIITFMNSGSLMNIPDLSSLHWRVSSFSGNNGTCVEVAALSDGHIALRNSRYPDAATIRCTRAEINVWIKGIKAGECDNLTC